MRINNNLMALNSHRQLGANQQAGAKSMERLSSGLRINRAGDDAAGLAISEKMRGQIRGLNQASRNAQDGISLIQTAEGALNESHAILQRMRELANQAANDTNVGVDREEIQKEIDQLSSEINRIGNTTEFNTERLLDGGGVSRLEATGLFDSGSPADGDTTHVEASQTITADNEVDASDLEAESIVVTMQGEEVTINFQEADLGGAGIEVDNDSVTSNSVTILVHGDSTSNSDLADAIVEAGNLVIEENQTLDGNFVFSNTNENITIAAVSEDSGGEFYGSLGYIAETADVNAITGAGDASVGTTTYTAAEFNIDFDGQTVEDLVATGFTIDGEQFEFYDSSQGVYTGTATGISLGGAGTDAEIAETVASQLNNYLAINENVASVEVDTGTNTQINIIAAADGEDGNCSVTIEDGGRSREFTANLQIGANTGQSMTIALEDMRSLALGITGDAAGGTVDLGDGNQAVFTSVRNVTDGTTNTNVEYALDVSDHENASAAITVINDAIEAVSAERSKLGSYQNRLEHTISNLGTSAENLQAAESRIRDLDMAQEMMDFTKSNILNQAATAMLAQANMAPQTVLQLLG